MPNGLSPIEWLLLQVNKPVSATAGAVLASRRGQNPLDAILANLAGERQDSFGDVLLNEGASPETARVAGLGADIALDPLNLVPIVGAGKLAVRGLQKGISKIPYAQDLGKVFDSVAGLPEEYGKSRRLLNSSLVNTKAQAVEDTVARFKGTSLQERQILSDAIENPAALDAIADPIRKQQLTDLLTSQRDAFSGMASREIDAGVLKQTQVDATLKEHGGYIPYVFNDTTKLQEVLKKPIRELSGQSKFSKERSLESFAKAKELGAETDLARLSAVRQASGERAIKVNQFLDNVFTNPEWAKPVAGLPGEYAAAGWRTISTNAANPVAEKIKQFAISPEIAGDLEKLLTPKKTSEFMKGFDKLTNVWKGVATTMKPGFHVRNLVSNAFNSWLGGMNPALMPKRYTEAIGIVGGKLPSKVGVYSGDELLSKMKEYGIVGREFGFVGDLSTGVDEALSQGLRTTKSKVIEGVATAGVAPALRAWSKAGKAVGSSVEDTSRVALFMNAVREGMTAEDAALHVKKYLFDYQELTDVERNGFRRVVPFYTWMRKNIPLQLEHFVATPHKYSNVASAYKEMEGAAEDRGISIPSIDRPDFLKKLGAVQLPFLSESGEKEFFNPNLPFQDLGKVVPTGENMQDQLASVHPLLKMVIERSMKKSIFKDRPLYKNDPSELVNAPMAAQLVAQTFPDLGKMLGVALHKVKGKPQWMMPERSSYAVENLLPVFNTLGKAAINTGSEETAAPLPILPEALNENAAARALARPPALDFFLGTKFLPQSDAQIRRDKKFKRDEARTLKKAQRKESNSRMSDEEIAAYFQ